MRKILKDKGITLIALVITIVILIILAAVAINLAVGENGIISKAKQAALMQKKAQYTEEISLEIIQEQTDRQIEASEEAFITSINERLTGEKQASNQVVSTYTKKPWIESTIMCDEEKNIHSDPFDNNRLYVYTTEGYELVIAVNNQSLSASIEEGSFQKTADKVNVTYNANGGTGDLEGDSVLPGFKVKLRENGFIRNRYTFTGWCKNQDGSGEKYQPGAEIKVTDDCTLYAVWSLNTVTITFDSNTGSGEMLPRDIDAGTEYQLTNNTFTKDGYEFSKWTTNADGTGDEYLDEGNITIDNDITLYANWTVKSYSITYALNGGNISGQKTTYTVEDEAFTLPTPTKDGYTFAGWTGTDLNTTSTSVTVPAGSTGTRAYTATWNVITYNISYTLNGGTGATNRTYTVEDSVTLPSPTKDAHVFAGWTGSGLSVATTSVTLPAGTTGDKSYTANWNVDSYTKFLYHFDDNSNDALGHTSQNVGTVTYSTDSKFGKSAYFNGSSYVTITVSEIDRLGDTFTIDWWEKPENNGSVFYSGYWGTRDGCLLLKYGGTNLYCSTVLSGWNMFSGVTAFSVTKNEWTHWALVRNGSSWKTYRNGTQFWSGTNSSTIGFNSNLHYNIARYRDQDENPFKGYIDEFRISLGIARWTSNFTVPNEPY